MINNSGTRPWRKSSHSYALGNCVEIREREDGGTDVRDSKNRDGPVLRVAANAWAAFLQGVRAGDVDRA